MSIRIRLVREDVEHIHATTLGDNFEYRFANRLLSVVYEADVSSYIERDEVARWIHENIPDSTIDKTDFEHHLILRVTIPTTESMIAFKLRWM